MAYATTSDIEARWRPLTEAEASRASTLLDDAAVIIDDLAGIDEATVDEATAAKAKIVSCDMVIRAMSMSQDAYGVSQASMTAGPYTQSWTYSSPSGDLYLTKLEKRMLGITSSYIGSIAPAVHVYPCECSDD